MNNLFPSGLLGGVVDTINHSSFRPRCTKLDPIWNYLAGVETTANHKCPVNY